MNVLLVTNDSSLEGLLTESFQTVGVRAEIFFVSYYRQIEHNLLYTDDIDAVFISPSIFGHISTISSGLIKRFVDAGFGLGKKPLVAIGGVNWTKDLVKAGCSHESTLLIDTLEKVVREISGKNKLQLSQVG